MEHAIADGGVGGISNPSTPGMRIVSHAKRRRAAADLIATAHSAGLGHGLCVADDMLQDHRNMLRQESPTPGGDHLGQCGNLGAIFG